jgi:Zn-dependent protease with chaperone function
MRIRRRYSARSNTVARCRTSILRMRGISLAFALLIFISCAAAQEFVERKRQLRDIDTVRQALRAADISVGVLKTKVVSIYRLSPGRQSVVVLTPANVGRDARPQEILKQIIDKPREVAAFKGGDGFNVFALGVRVTGSLGQASFAERIDLSSSIAKLRALAPDAVILVGVRDVSFTAEGLRMVGKGRYVWHEPTGDKVHVTVARSLDTASVARAIVIACGGFLLVLWPVATGAIGLLWRRNAHAVFRIGYWIYAGLLLTFLAVLGVPPRSLDFIVALRAWLVEPVEISRVSLLLALLSMIAMPLAEAWVAPARRPRFALLRRVLYIVRAFRVAYTIGVAVSLLMILFPPKDGAGASLMIIFWLPLILGWQAVSYDEGVANPELAARVSELAKVVDIEPPEVRVSDQGVLKRHVNAFMLPGGRLLVGKQLLEQGSKEEVDFVLAHELAHHKLRHIEAITNAHSRARHFVLPLSLFGLYVLLWDPWANFSLFIGMACVLLAVILLARRSPNQHDFELAADRMALDATGNLAAAESVVTKLLKSPSKRWDKLSTHPAAERRVDNLRNHASVIGLAEG